MRTVTGSTLDELKEKFVRNRFAERQYFGRVDIEGWLAKQKVTERPDFSVQNFDRGERSEWAQALSLLHKPGIQVPLCNNGETGVAVFRRLGLKLDDLNKKDISQEVLDPSLSQYFDFHSTVMKALSSEVFLTPDQFVAIVTTDYNEEMILRFEPGMGKGGTYSRSYLTQNIVESILLTWFVLESGDPRKYQARAYLCDWLERCIQKVRADTEAEFDKAVAVSRDGKKIVSAEWVVEWEQTDHECLYSVQATSKDYYHKKKIVRTEELIRLDEQIINIEISALDAQTVKNIICDMFQFSLEDIGKQYFFTLKNSVTGDTCTCFVLF